MIRISATEFAKSVGRYEHVALSQPVVVTHDGRDRTVMISMQEYQRLKRLDRQVFAAGDLPDEIVDAVGSGQMDIRHASLDALLKNWKR